MLYFGCKYNFCKVAVIKQVLTAVRTDSQWYFRYCFLKSTGSYKN